MHLNRRLFDTSLRFLLGGGINTLITFALYYLLLRFFDYGVAYVISYIAGIFLSYVLNTSFVFRVDHSFRKLLRFPIVYMVTYVVGAGVLHASVEWLGVDKTVAPLIAVIFTVPIGYFLSRYVLCD